MIICCRVSQVFSVHYFLLFIDVLPSLRSTVVFEMSINKLQLKTFLFVLNRSYSAISLNTHNT